jgi:outer membrane protein assembly factor BamD
MKGFLYWIATGALLVVSVLSCSHGAVKEQLPPYEQYRKAMTYYDNKNYFKAQGEFQKVIYSYPGLTFIDTAQYYLAMSLFNDKNFPEAGAEFRHLLQAYPTSAFADDAQYNLAMSYFRQSPGASLDQTETYTAIDELSSFLDKYSTSPLAAEARGNLDLLYDKLAKKLYRSGELYLKMGDYDPAVIYFQQVRDNYPNTAWAALAFFGTGEAQMKSGKKTDALETFQNFVIAFPDNKLVAKAQKNIVKLSPEQRSGE